jgi:hypothetical protein
MRGAEDVASGDLAPPNGLTPQVSPHHRVLAGGPRDKGLAGGPPLGHERSEGRAWWDVPLPCESTPAPFSPGACSAPLPGPMLAKPGELGSRGTGSHSDSEAVCRSPRKPQRLADPFWGRGGAADRVRSTDRMAKYQAGEGTWDSGTLTLRREARRSGRSSTPRPLRKDDFPEVSIDVMYRAGMHRPSYDPNRTPPERGPARAHDRHTGSRRSGWRPSRPGRRSPPRRREGIRRSPVAAPAFIEPNLPCRREGRTRRRFDCGSPRRVPSPRP